MRVLALFLAVVFLWVGTPIAMHYLFPNADWAVRGQIEDLFGSVNALFSGLAFAGLYWALRLQSDQLELQRQELRLQREEMAASRRELANQVDAQEALTRATVAQIAVAAAQARIEALQWDAYQWNANSDARSRLAVPVREIAAELQALHDRLMERRPDREG